MLPVHVSSKVRLPGSDHVSELVSERGSAPSSPEGVVLNFIVEGVMVFEVGPVKLVFFLTFVFSHLSPQFFRIRFLLCFICVEIGNVLRVEGLRLRGLRCLERWGFGTIYFGCDTRSGHRHLWVINGSFRCSIALVEVRALESLRVLYVRRNLVVGLVVKNKTIVAFVRFLATARTVPSALRSGIFHFVLNVLSVFISLVVLPVILILHSKNGVIAKLALALRRPTRPSSRERVETNGAP